MPKKLLTLLVALSVLFSLFQPAAVLAAAADANADGTVDGLDYVIWLNNYNQTVSNGTTSGDFDANGFVDGLDYVLWLNSYMQPNQPTPVPSVINTPSPALQSCLKGAGPLINLSGNQTTRYDTRSNTLAPSVRVDAVSASWTANWPVQDSFNYPVLLHGGPDICFSGGVIQGNYPDQISSDPNATWEYMHGTSAMKVSGENSIIENIRIDNYGDGIGFESNTRNFAIKGTYLSKIRDDCLENDWLNSGLIEDSLFDGCYSAFSARTYSGQNPPADGTNNILTINNSLIRLQASWGVYKNRGLIPGHDGFFKWDSLGISPKISLHNNIFRADQLSNNVGLGIPSGKLIDCSKNVMVWLGSGNYPDPLPTAFNGQPCFTLTTDISVWDKAVTDWKSRHGY